LADVVLSRWIVCRVTATAEERSFCDGYGRGRSPFVLDGRPQRPSLPSQCSTPGGSGRFDSYRPWAFGSVHAQDIALPLGRRVPMPPEAAAAAATRVWPFWARRRLRAVRLVADDVNWSVETGPDVTGPIDALLLPLTGRTVALPRLTGAGLARATGQT